jgi:hypothetical protein
MESVNNVRHKKRVVREFLVAEKELVLAMFMEVLGLTAALLVAGRLQ